MSNIDGLSKNAIEEQEKLRIPGDISDAAKQSGILVPWKEAIISNASIVLVLVLSSATLLSIFLLWPKLYGRTGVGKHP